MSYKYFTEEEFACQETGENKIVPEFVERLDELREACNFPFHITSGYRSSEHSIEKAKVNFGGIGVAKTFVHVDIRTTGPVMWTY